MHAISAAPAVGQVAAEGREGTNPEPRLLRAANPQDIVAAATLLREGGVAIVPTDTVYGLAASVFRADAVERIFAVKQRAPEARVPVLLASAADLSVLVEDVPRLAWKLIDVLWPGPLTLVLPARSSAPDVITRGTDTVAVRVPGARSCLQLLATLGEPLVGTSANRSGQPPALTAQEAFRQVGSGVDAVLADDAAIRVGVSSTVVELAHGRAIVHREGAVSVEVIRGLLGASVNIRRELTS
ncbi:MAG: threonylcarbamoyl-AMP synthase [Chloroflexi bacterium]|nr:threonylcarbamoyl-AMP synthase [Chloroflexota bacterium]